MTPFYFNAENFQEGQGKTFLALFVYKHVYLVIVDQTVSRKFGLWGRGWTSVQRRWGRSRVVARCPILLHFRFSIHSVFSRDHTPTLFTGWEHELFSKLLVWKKECVLFFCPLSFFFLIKEWKSWVKFQVHNGCYTGINWLFFWLQDVCGLPAI